MNLKRLLFNFIILLALSSAAFSAGYLAHTYLKPGSEYPILAEAQNILKKHALNDLPENPALEYGMIHGMLNALGDPYTRFVEPVQTELNNDSLEGSYGGIGAALDRDPEGFIVLHPFPESPARRAGIQDGDRLIQIDGVNITPETPIEEAVAALRGPVGDSVSLTMARPPEYQTLSFDIERQSIPLPSVTWHRAPSEPRLGVIKVNIIAASTAEEIENAIVDLESQGVIFFVLDLRGNGGGLVDAGVDIARLFLQSGDILQEQYRQQPIETYQVEQPGAFSDIPLAVLVDANSASAAEIIAGALQAQGRATIIGTPTFGKDTIQLAFALQDGSSMHITAAKWWIPGLNTAIGETGLIPDILVEPDENLSDPLIDAATTLFNTEP